MRSACWATPYLADGDGNDITPIERSLAGIRTGLDLTDKGYDAQRAIDTANASGAGRARPAA